MPAANHWTQTFVDDLKADWTRCLNEFGFGEMLTNPLKPFHDQDGVALLWRPKKSGQGIFLSYRRDESGFVARGLHADLERVLEMPVHVDFNDFYGGLNLRRAIQELIVSSFAVLLLVDSRWSMDGYVPEEPSASQDWVRFELECAFANIVPVVPVIIEEAKLPSLNQLPPTLRDLADLLAVRLTHEHWHTCVDRIAASLRNHVQSAADFQNIAAPSRTQRIS